MKNQITTLERELEKASVPFSATTRQKLLVGGSALAALAIVGTGVYFLLHQQKPESRIITESAHLDNSKAHDTGARSL